MAGGPIAALREAYERLTHGGTVLDPAALYRLGAEAHGLAADLSGRHRVVAFTLARVFLAFADKLDGEPSSIVLMREIASTLDTPVRHALDNLEAPLSDTTACELIAALVDAYLGPPPRRS
jgi:hypothetical protein